MQTGTVGTGTGGAGRLGAPDLYQILGLRRDAGSEEIRSAYLSLARRYHPDLNAGLSGADEAFKEVGFAYAVLSDARARALYDVYGDSGMDDPALRTALTRPDLVQAASDLVAARGDWATATSPPQPAPTAAPAQGPPPGVEAPPAPVKGVAPSSPRETPRSRARRELARRLDAWAAPLPRPLVSRAEHVAEAAGSAGREWLRALRRVEESFVGHSLHLRQTAERLGHVPAPTPGPVTERIVLSGLHGALLALGALLAAAALAYLNAGAVAARLEELGSTRLGLPGAATLARHAWTIGAATSLGAVLVGMLRRALAAVSEGEGSSGLVTDLAATIALVCLVGVQMLAYAGLGGALQAAGEASGARWAGSPQALALASALVGAGALMLLVALGSALWLGVRACLAAVASLLTPLHAAAAHRRFDALERRRRKAEEDLLLLESLTTSLGRRLADRANLEGAAAVADTLRRFSAEVRPAGAEGPPPPPASRSAPTPPAPAAAPAAPAAAPRSRPFPGARTRALLTMTVDLLLLGAGVLSAVALARAVGAAPGVDPRVAAQLALSLPAMLLVSGFLAREIWKRAGGVEPLGETLPHARARRTVALAAAAVAAAGVLLAALLPAALAPRGPELPTLALSGALPAAVLVLVALRLDRGLLAAGRLALALPLLLRLAVPEPSAGTGGRSLLLALLLLSLSSDAMAQTAPRPRAREAGVVVGTLAPGPENAITDVAGVRVGHATIRSDSVNTGVTAILPPGESWFQERVPAAIVVGNGFGKLLGVTQVRELGELETPVLLTCTLCVWRAADAMVEWLLARPGMGNVGSINPVVGETNDGGLNDIRSRPITPAHVVQALEGARGGPVEEGSVGAGTGTRALGFKGGIGTASRVLGANQGGYTVGVLVQTNYGGSLTIAGVPVGRELARSAGGAPEEEASGDGSIMMVVATDAPLSSRNLERLATRALVGLARTGSTMSNGSGDYVIAFSTAESVRRVGAGPFEVRELGNNAMSGLFTAVADATEEAIYNSLFKAETVRGRGNTSEAMPVERVLEILRARGALAPGR